MQLKPYSKYKDSGIEWIGEIPEGWEVRKISSFGFFSSSGIDKKTEPDESLVKMVNYTDIYGNDFLVIDSKRELMTVSCPRGKITFCNLKEGDIVFTPSSETEEDIGLSAVILENLKNTVFSYHVIRFRPIIKINLLYKKYIGNNHFVLSQFSRTCKGTTRQILTHNDFKGILIVLPPIEDQTTIANFLDKKTAKIDSLIEKDKKLIELLKEKRTALINHVVTKGLDPNVKLKDSWIDWIGVIPEGWEVRRIDKLSTVRRGASPRPIDDPKYFDEEGEYSWVRIADVTASERYLKETVEKLSVLGKSLSVPLEPGRLFVSIAGTVGKPIITKIKCCIHDGFVYFQNLKVFNAYLYYIFVGGQVYLGLGKLGTQLNLNTETIGLITIPLPPKPEQQKIANFLDKATSKIDKTIQKIEDKTNLLEEYKKSLIHHVVTGKVDVRGAS